MFCGNTHYKDGAYLRNQAPSGGGILKLVKEDHESPNGYLYKYT